MRTKKMKSVLALSLAFALTAASVVATGTGSDAASKKKVKSVTLKINKKKVTKKTYSLAKGKTASIKVTVNPSSAKKKVAFKSGKKSVASVTAKGKVTAKKAGTAKITVTVTGKNKKKKSTWVKIKVTDNTSDNSTANATATPGTSAGATATPATSASATATPANTTAAAPTATATNAPGTDSTGSPAATATNNPDAKTTPAGDSSEKPSAAPTGNSDKPSATPVASTPTPTPKTFTVNANPISTTDDEGNPIYGGDPSVLVDGDTLYLYTGHDVTSEGSSYAITEYLCYSTKDMKTWNYHGSVLHMKDVTWDAPFRGQNDTQAWAAQVMKYNNKYYLYFCSWDSTSNGEQSIGVAVSDSPTGPFVDLGKPLIKSTITTGVKDVDNWSEWNDIDPTAWIETDENGEEHRYLLWGNGKMFVCELNEDMVSVKDVNNDGKITFGKQADGATSKTADILEKKLTWDFREAPYLYRRQDAQGNYTGPYYIFTAWAWREKMCYATTDDLMDGTVDFGASIMDPTATSDTNHMAVFDFNGKTWFIYHNGSLPGGFGQRRSACITELTFNEDGSVEPMLETVSGNGFFDCGLTKLYSATGDRIYHERYTNSSLNDDYPYLNVKLGTFDSEEVDDIDGEWVFSAPLASVTDTESTYVSIQSENKPGLYITANNDKTATLAHPQPANATAAIMTENAKAQTFKVVAGLADENGISFESVAQEGMYLTNLGGTLYLTDGSRTIAATFYKDALPEILPTDTHAGTTNSITKLEVGKSSALSEITADGEGNYSAYIDPLSDTFQIKLTLADDKGYATIDGTLAESGSTYTLPFSSMDETDFAIDVYAQNSQKVKTVTLTARKDLSKLNADFSKYHILKAFNFEDSTDGAVAVTRGTTSQPEVANPTYTYTDGVNGGKAIVLPPDSHKDNNEGEYGLKLLSDTSSLGDTYTVSFWMKPSSLNGAVDPIFCAGTFSPEKWLNLTWERPIWAGFGWPNYKDSDPATLSGLYTVNEWQHVALVVNNGTGTLYVDGVEKGTNANLTGMMTSTGAAAFFGVNGWDEYYHGAVDEIMFFNGALSRAEVVSLAFNLESCNSLTAD